MTFGTTSWVMHLSTPEFPRKKEKMSPTPHEKEKVQPGPATGCKPSLLYLMKLFYFHKDLQTY